jgi:hypothetical protein
VFAHLPKLYESTVEEAILSNNDKKYILEKVKKGLTMKWKTSFGKDKEGTSKLDDKIEET